MLLLTVLMISCGSSTKQWAPSPENPIVVMKTNFGNIVFELYPDRAPIGVKNFLNYVNKGHYNGTIFHRVMPGFMVQGGGFDQSITEKPTDKSIENEADNGLRNRRGTLSYARTLKINSATSQFFVNLVNNYKLDFKNHTQRGYGYAVFGHVVRGMNVVDAIAKVQTGTRKQMQDVPLRNVVIENAYVLDN
ncbi:peptidyl-prolyl cis-trans isomerase [bacterium]|nr:peptidyl-prolyl cis-trans isomerase [bacterium]